MAKTLYPTTTLCPTCNRLVPGTVEEREEGIFIARRCPEHGEADGLVCSDLEWYAQLPAYDVAPIRPRSPRSRVEKGCPEDCGLCPAHRQIAGTAAIEISNHCNAACPVCLADNVNTFEVSPEEAAQAVAALLRSQEQVEVLTLSGGEPTIHPRLFEIIRAVDRPEVGRIAINSNGVRLARDDAFLDELARYPKVYVSLHFDGSGARRLRGVDPEVQRRALERLGRWGIRAAPVVLAARGVNDGELGGLVRELLTEHAHVHTVILSMMTYTGSRGASFAGDARTRLTIPGALEAIAQGSGGAISKRDFMPLPMPNPLCAAIGYFHVEGGELTGLLPFGERERLLAAAGNSNFGALDARAELLLREAIDRIYSEPERYPGGERLLRKFRELLEAVFPEGGATPAQQLAAAEARVKSVYLMQFMDAWTFDSKRLCKCSCQHLLPDGQIVPSCSYYAFHRRRDPRFQGAP